MCFKSLFKRKRKQSNFGNLALFCITALLFWNEAIAHGGKGQGLAPQPGSVAAMMKPVINNSGLPDLGHVPRKRLAAEKKATNREGLEESPLQPEVKPPIVLPVTPVGDPDRFEELVSNIETDGVLPMGEYMLEEMTKAAKQSSPASYASCKYGVCRMNTTPKHCLKRMVKPFGRDSFFRKFNAIPDTVWVLNPDIVKAIFSDGFGVDTKKLDTFYAFRVLMGEYALFSSDMTEAHKERRKQFKANLGGDTAMRSYVTAALMEHADRFVGEWTDLPSSQTDDITNIVVDYLSPGLIHSIFGVDISQHKEKQKEIVSHLSGIIPLFALINNDPKFYLSYMYPTPMMNPMGYLKKNYPLLFEKQQLIMKDLEWLIGEAFKLDPSEQGLLFKNVVKKSREAGRDHLNADDLYDLINPMIAGGDTGAGLLTLALTEFARSPELQDEILEEFRIAGGASIKDQDIAASKLHKLFEFIEEVLTRYTPAPIIARRMADDKDLILVDQDTGERVKIEFKRNDLVSFPISFLNPHAYSPNPFISPEEKTASHDDRKKCMVTFANGSSHQCVGEHLGKQLMAVLLVSSFKNNVKPGLVQPFKGYSEGWAGVIKVNARVPLKLYPLDEELGDLAAYAEVVHEDKDGLAQGMERMKVKLPGINEASELRLRQPQTVH
ncbi:cytochrome P450 [Parendozoicomonas haliclonae]|uniref:Cytochrome P450 n=1 Tax=Parendozoicomonas haliclonae TaxID=1960125 RepID=A0A1X7AJG9_9GAMM|nr:cytochrome P450 [Parendozoicomonas haliclonae]SMA46601.1 Cytochrome P450 [Parendozoicomonas haliclonae]